MQLMDIAIVTTLQENTENMSIGSDEPTQNVEKDIQVESLLKEVKLPQVKKFYAKYYRKLN